MLIESLEESKRVATEINIKVAQAKTTEVDINENRNKYRPVAARGAMLFFLLNSLNKIHAFYQFSLNAFVVVFGRGLDLAPGGRKKKDKTSFRSVLKKVSSDKVKDFDATIAEAEQAVARSRPASAAGTPKASESGEPPAEKADDEEVDEDAEPEEDEGPEDFSMTPEQLEKRMESLLDTCTYTVFNYTRRGLFDRDKLIVLSLLTFSILQRAGSIDESEYGALCRGTKTASPPPITDDLSRWMSEGQWGALDALTQVTTHFCWPLPLAWYHTYSVQSLSCVAALYCLMPCHGCLLQLACHLTPPLLCLRRRWAPSPTWPRTWRRTATTGWRGAASRPLSAPRCRATGAR